MAKRGILITGEVAGKWYAQTAQRVALQHAQSMPVLQKTDFSSINPLLPEGKTQAASWLKEELNRAHQNQLSPLILANITLHEAYDLLGETYPGFIHIKQLLAEALPNAARIMILGTLYTMRSSYVASLLPKHVLQIKASAAHEVLVDELRKIYFSGADANAAKTLWQTLRTTDPQVDFFVLACTELAVAANHFLPKAQIINLPELQISSLLGQKFV
jgi:aspartate/glutamate racemase